MHAWVLRTVKKRTVAQSQAVRFTLFFLADAQFQEDTSGIPQSWHGGHSERIRKA